MCWQSRKSRIIHLVVIISKQIQENTAQILEELTFHTERSAQKLSGIYLAQIFTYSSLLRDCTVIYALLWAFAIMLIILKHVLEFTPGNVRGPPVVFFLNKVEQNNWFTVQEVIQENRWRNTSHENEEIASIWELIIRLVNLQRRFELICSGRSFLK